MIERKQTLKRKRIIITGCGYNTLQRVFYDITTGAPSHDSIFTGGIEHKLNIGAATAQVLAEHGALVHMISTSAEKLRILKSHIKDNHTGSKVSYSVVDLLDPQNVKQFVHDLPKDKPLYWVQSVGLGAGSYKLKDNNPYLALEDIPLELLEKEATVTLRATHLLMQEFLPIFKKQKETRIAIVSSMSAIRGYSLGGTHCAAKAAIDRYANAAMLALYKHNIFVTTIRPGCTDTGIYDNYSSLKAVVQISDEYHGTYRKQFASAPPHTVGETIACVLTTRAHIPSINLVAQGQWPHEGS